MQDSTIKGSDDQHPTMHRAAPPRQRTLVMSLRGSQAEHAISRKWHVSDVLQAVDVAWLKVTGRGNTGGGLLFPDSPSLCLLPVCHSVLNSVLPHNSITVTFTAVVETPRQMTGTELISQDKSPTA